jgi:hypothetical protein
MLHEFMKNLTPGADQKTPELRRKNKGDLLRWFRSAFRRRSSGKYCYPQYWRVE